jgi:hypothetical protein
LSEKKRKKFMNSVIHFKKVCMMMEYSWNVCLQDFFLQFCRIGLSKTNWTFCGLQIPKLHRGPLQSATKEFMVLWFDLLYFWHNVSLYETNLTFTFSDHIVLYQWDFSDHIILNCTRDLSVTILSCTCGLSVMTLSCTHDLSMTMLSSSMTFQWPHCLASVTFQWPHCHVPMTFQWPHCHEPDWLIIYNFASRSRIFHLYGDVTIAG